MRAACPVRAAAVATALAGLGCSLAIETTRRLLDTWFDDAAGSLHAAGVGLRLRESPGGRALAYQRRSVAAGGLFVDETIELPWPTGNTAHSARDLPPPLRDRVEPLTLARPLTAHLQLAIGREQGLLRLPAGNTARLTLDRVQLLAGERRLEFGELAIAVEPAVDATPLAAVVRQLATLLQTEPAVDDQPSHAARLLGRSPRSAHASADAAVGLPQLLLVAQRAEVTFRCDCAAANAQRWRQALAELRAGVAAAIDAGLADDLQATWPILTDALGQATALDHLDAAMDAWPTAAAWPGPLRPSMDDLQHAWLRRRQQRAAAMVDWLSTPARLQAWQSLQDAGPQETATSDWQSRFATALRRRIHHTAADLRQQLQQLTLVDEPGTLAVLAEQCEHLHACLAIQYPSQPPGDREQDRRLLRELLETAARLEGAQRLLAAALDGTDAQALPPRQAAATGHWLSTLHRAGRKARKRLHKKLPELLRRRCWRDLLEPPPQLGDHDANLA
jgi:inorganic triphosphatase YgiF